LARFKNYFSQLLNLNGDSDVRQTEIHTAEPLVLEPSASEAEMAAEKRKRYKSPGIDQIPEELINEGGRTICSENRNLLILFGIKRNCLSSVRSQSFYLFIRRAIKKIAVTIVAYHSCQLHTKFYQTSFW
jgi:hypothetical protein